MFIKLQVSVLVPEKVLGEAKETVTQISTGLRCYDFYKR